MKNFLSSSVGLKKHWEKNIWRLLRYKNEDELADEAKVWLCSLRFLHNIPNIKPQFLRLKDLGTWKFPSNFQLPPGGFKCNLHIARLPRNCREFTRFTVAYFFFVTGHWAARAWTSEVQADRGNFRTQASRMFEWSNKKVFPALRISYKQRDQFQNKGHASVITGAKIRSGRPPA